MRTAPPLPDSCGVAFKEWRGVCEALDQGLQSLILRKGGIAEGPSGFVPEHHVFWLYPTRVHEAEQGLRVGGVPRVAPDAPEHDVVRIRNLAAVETIGFVDRLETLAALAEHHVWTDETVEKRFHYRKPGLWVLGVRVYRRTTPLVLPITPEHAGCKTWVSLEPALGTNGLAPVLEEGESHRRIDRLRATLDQSR